ncbi:MAG: ABC transporter permease [Eubacteriales bacterium]|nr:ABC transporter permease [Eubacteriales bacterium]
MKLKLHNPNRMIRLGCVIIALIVFASIFSDRLSSHDPFIGESIKRLLSPSPEHLLGTDQQGRDVFPRVLYGGRWTLTASFITMVLTLILGMLMGILSGYFSGSWLDILILRVIDCLMGFPFMILAMIISGLFGRELTHLLMAVLMVKWIPFARLTRSIVLRSKNEVRVLAAKVSGCSSWKIIIKESVPEIWSPAFALATFELGELILSISALSFFGLGAKPPTPEWGAMLADSKAYFFQTPYLVVGPSLFIFMTVLGLNFIGEGLRDRLTPYEILKI